MKRTEGVKAGKVFSRLKRGLTRENRKKEALHFEGLKVFANL